MHDQGLLDANDCAALVRFSRGAPPDLDFLTVAQLAVMKRALYEEEERREHVVVYLSGAHAARQRPELHRACPRTRFRGQLDGDVAFAFCR